MQSYPGYQRFYLACGGRKYFASLRRSLEKHFWHRAVFLTVLVELLLYLLDFIKTNHSDHIPFWSHGLAREDMIYSRDLTDVAGSNSFHYSCGTRNYVLPAAMKSFLIGNLRCGAVYWSEPPSSPHIHIWIKTFHIWIYVDKTIW